MIDVVIAGAGPTGLTLACDLTRRGVRCRVLDKAPGLAPGSRGVTLKPRSLEVFDDLGVADQVLAGSLVESRTRYRFGDGRSLAVHVPPGKPSPARPYPNSVALPQWRTRELLLDRLEELGGTVEFGRAVTGVTTGADAVQVETEDGETTEITETIEARYLVGADGGRSAVRGALGVPFPGSTHTTRALLGDVHVAGLRREDGVHMWVAADGHMVVARPLAGSDLWQVVGSLSEDPGEDLLARLRAVVAERTGRADLRLTDPAWLSLWRYNLRMVDSYRVGRVFLAGDAAHVHSPFGGHGMNTGLQDAYNLGWKLALVLQGIADDRLLDTYQAERLPAGKAILADSHRKLATRTPPKALRPVLRLLVNQTFKRRARRMNQERPTYSDSPLTRDDVTRGPIRAGEPVPDAPVVVAGRPARLFDLLRGPHFTVVSFGVPVPELGDHVHVHTVGADLADPKGLLRRGFGARAGTVAVIRPDGYLGLITHQATEHTVADYLRAIGVRPRSVQPSSK